jgi:hypothetical protein
MEMDNHELEAIVERRHTILNIVTFMEKGIKIIDFDRFMWT